MIRGQPCQIIKILAGLKNISRSFINLQQLTMTLLFGAVMTLMVKQFQLKMDYVELFKLKVCLSKVRRDLRHGFFGGSTTFGTGVNDKYTYPSMLAQKTGYHVTNFGGTGYSARQSLALLNNTYIVNPREEEQSGKRSVVFYDGVNDVADRCRSEIQGLATGRQSQIQERLKSARLSFLATFSQVIFFLQKVVAWTDGEPTTNQSGYDCDLNPKKSKFIALSLVKTWEQASWLAKANGDEFIAILQPVAFIGNPSLSHLDLSNADSVALKKQYEAVYPIIRQIASSAPINFVDLTDAYDKCDYCYIDFCHVSPNAHEILVDLMINKLDV